MCSYKNKLLILLCNLCLMACGTENKQKDSAKDTTQNANKTLTARKIIDQANVLLGSAEYQKAIKIYNQAIQLAKEDSMNAATAYHNRGLAFQYLKDTTQALDNYEKAMLLDKTYNSPYSSRGSIRLDRKDFQGAIDDFNKSAELDPQNALTYFLRGNAKNALKDNEGACEDWNKALALGFNDAKFTLEQSCK